MLKRSFAPVANERTRLLLLGSLPGEESLARGRYYAHPRNQFWRLAGAVIAAELEPLPYEARLEALLAAGIGLWDVVASARRRGPSDRFPPGRRRRASRARSDKRPCVSPRPRRSP